MNRGVLKKLEETKRELAQAVGAKARSRASLVRLATLIFGPLSLVSTVCRPCYVTELTGASCAGRGHGS